MYVQLKLGMHVHEARINTHMFSFKAVVLLFLLLKSKLEKLEACINYNTSNCSGSHPLQLMRVKLFSYCYSVVHLKKKLFALDIIQKHNLVHSALHELGIDIFAEIKHDTPLKYICAALTWQSIFLPKAATIILWPASF